ncbi:MAG TPA: glycosyltransferase family 2 protein [Amycolatopsis sp.]|nr:glycosyltransferase family 2 protein [Amycolatopsis sp.]
MTEERSYGDKLAVVTVTYFAGETLEKFLDTLDKASDREVRVVVADNASTDGAPEQAARREGVELVSIGENVGYGTAANRGVAALSDDYGWVVVVNPDVEWEPGSLDALLEVASRWPRGAAFGPLIHDLDGTVYPSARLLPSFGRGIGHAVFSKIWPTNPWTRQYRQESATPVERTSEWLSGSCQLFRREAFDAVGGFDTRYFMYFEDVDLGDRLTKAGWLNVYAPSSSVMHIGGASTARVSKKMLRAHHASAYRYLADRHPGLLWKPVLAAVKLGLAVRVKLEGA